MAVREQDTLTYRTPATAAPAVAQTSADQDNYDTLRMIGGIFADAINGLYKEFNAFDILSDGTDEEKRDKLMRQIAGNQIAYDILAPLLERINSAVQTVNDRFN